MPPDWIAAHRWVGWSPPRNAIAGEARYAAALITLVGPPCESGYCLPVIVRLTREPNNPYDANALRAEVRGRRVGYLRREYAAILAPEVDAVRCRSFDVAGVIRGGSLQAPSLGCHVWLERRVSRGPEIEMSGAAHLVSWPPYEREVFGG